jgi:hypothetical protein
MSSVAHETMLPCVCTQSWLRIRVWGLGGCQQPVALTKTLCGSRGIEATVQHVFSDCYFSIVFHTPATYEMKKEMEKAMDTLFKNSNRPKHSVKSDGAELCTALPM